MDANHNDDNDNREKDTFVESASFWNGREGKNSREKDKTNDS